MTIAAAPRLALLMCFAAAVLCDRSSSRGTLTRPRTSSCWRTGSSSSRPSRAWSCCPTTCSAATSGTCCRSGQGGVGRGGGGDGRGGAWGRGFAGIYYVHVLLLSVTSGPAALTTACTCRPAGRAPSRSAQVPYPLDGVPTPTREQVRAVIKLFNDRDIPVICAT